VTIKFYIIRNLYDPHAYLLAIYLKFHAIACLFVLVHFEFSHHKYLIPFLFISVKLKHLPFSGVYYFQSANLAL